MNKIFKPILGVGAFCISVGMMSSVLLTLTSCYQNKSSNVVKINNEFATKEKSLQNAYGLPKINKDKTIDDTGKLFIENAQNAINKLNDYKDKNINILKLNEKIWLESYIYNWKTKINNWNNGLQYLGGNPSGDALPLNPNSNHLDDLLNSKLNIFEIDNETLEPVKDIDHVDKNLAYSYVNVGTNLVDYIDSLTILLKKGESFGVMESNITKKLFLNQMLTNYYPQELLFWQSKDKDNHGSEIALPINEKEHPRTNALLANYSIWEDWAKAHKLSETIINECKSNLIKAQEALDNFINWYTNVYFVSKNSYGTTSLPNITPLRIYKENPVDVDEIEKIVYINNGKEMVPIYGLGINDKELELKNVGFGYMNSKLVVNNKNVTGNNIYQALLQFNNSVNKTPVELVSIGTKNTKDSIEKMKQIGKQIAELNKNNWDKLSTEWKPQFYYREDISSSEKAKQITESVYKDEELNWTNFNHWLNQEDFFFGREIGFWNEKYHGGDKTNLDVYTNKLSGDTFAKYLDILDKLGYAGTKGAWAINPDKPINGVDGDVDGKHALAGAVLSLFVYNDFKQKTKPLFTRSFNPIPDYNVAPYNIKIESIIGVGLEGPRGSNIFNYNVNPYYSLPKWSQSSFQDHEGSMGHHTQQSYWTKYMEGGAGIKNRTPGYTFKLDAYHEGWAVFTEWFAAELGVYGTWGQSKQQGADYLPSDWINAKGFVPTIKDINNPTEQEINDIKNFQAGVYWSVTDGFVKQGNLSDDQSHAIAAVKAANMLQYYGFKNEAQLRNMRLVVDPAYHYKPEHKEKIDDEKLNYGGSIKDIREYLKANSGLGEGDIKSESYRYLNMPAQATGYMTGKSILEQCYKAVKNQYAATHEGKLIIDDLKEIRKLFDLILRNGEIPLNIVQQIIKEVYHVNLDEYSLK